MASRLIGASRARAVALSVSALILLSACGQSDDEAAFDAAERACKLVGENRLDEAYDASIEAAMFDTEQWGGLSWSLMIISDSDMSGPIGDSARGHLAEAQERLADGCRPWM